ncbi:MAG TPA: metallophosphoesterase [Candidatus Limnocylindria bacterium]|nr:metallophosphoesterase [Candidatus Limnocylindria bacterium]
MGSGSDPSGRTRDDRLRAHSVVVSLVLVAVFVPMLDDMARRSLRVGGVELPSQQSVAGAADSATPGASAGAPVLPTATPDQVPELVLAVGDLTNCPEMSSGVPELVASLPGPLLAVGDIVDPGGSYQEYRDCYEPQWGALRDRIWPVPGNHDYNVPGAGPYFAYFGLDAGTPGAGWYSRDLGWWHVVALNSICPAVGGCDQDSQQVQWLIEDLAAHPARCTLAFFHHPRFSSGDGAAPPRTETIWKVLYDAGADVVLNGHDHHYDRFAPLAPDGSIDERRGIRQFTVGTGGASRSRGTGQAPQSEFLTREHHGVLQLALHRDRYEWQFISAADGAVIDSGSDTCH